MTNAIRSEIRKLFSTRLWWGLAIAIFLVGAGFAALFGFALTSASGLGPGGPTGTQVQIVNSVYTQGLTVGNLLMLTIGVMQIGAEYRHKTITATFLATPKRLTAMLAKVVTLIGAGAMYGVIFLLGSVSVGALVLNSQGVDPFPSSEVFRTLALSLLVLGLWALIGLGIGILIPNQVAALLIGIGVAWIVEPLLALGISALWDWGRDHLVRFFPSEAGSAIVNSITQSGADAPARLSWWAGALVLAGWAAVLAGFGIVRTVRQDVS